MAADSDVEMWSTAISSDAHNGRKIIFRYPSKFSPTFDRTSQSIRIIIVWKYQSEGGQPIKEEHQRMNQLEDALESVLDQDRFATLALVSTGEDLREWIYYAKSEDGFMARLNYAFAGMPEFPIEIHIAHDPEWASYEEFASSLKTGANLKPE
jgi:Family of unknown function (DUF695)